MLKIVSSDIAAVIRSGVRRLESERQDILIKGLVNRTKKQSYTFDLTFHKPKIDNELSQCCLIEFSSDKELKYNNPLLVKNLEVEEVSSQRLEDLENELKVVKTELQNAIEELETSNEELQSVNEELYTVNSEMQEKNKELTNLSNDVTNLLDNTDIATLFLDTDLRIRKFTPALKEVFNLHEADYGRALSSFTSNFEEKTRVSIIEDAELVLNKLITVEKQVKDKNNNFYLERISPFITTEKRINGVVITFNNINKLKETEKELADTDLRYHKLFENLNEGFIHAKIITNREGKAVDWEYIDVNPAYEKITGLKVADIIGKRVSEFLPNLKNDPNNWIEAYGKTALTGESQTIEGYVYPLKKYFFVNAFCPKKGEFAGTIADFTDLKKKEIELSKSEAELKRVQKITKVGSWYLDIETNQVEWTTQLYEIYGFDPSHPPAPYTEHEKLFTKESWELLSASVEKTKNEGIPYNLELNMIRQKGS